MLCNKFVYVLSSFVCVKNCSSTCRDSEESDTASTDADCGWGGSGMFEYSKKCLPHALVHARELVETYGHHGACCTCVGEAGHKTNIKTAAKFARTYGDRNVTQDGMLQYVQRQQLWTAVNELNEKETTNEEYLISASAEQHSIRPEGHQLIESVSSCHRLREPLPELTQGWSSMRPVQGQPPRTWGATFLSNRVLITRNELVTLLRTKLKMQETWENITLLATRVEWACYGCLLISDADDEDKCRKLVGTSTVTRERRDFVRIKGKENDTALSVQVCLTYTCCGVRIQNKLVFVYVFLRTSTSKTFRVRFIYST